MSKRVPSKSRITARTLVFGLQDPQQLMVRPKKWVRILRHCAVHASENKREK